ncbi:unnamed protein product [Caenorhabditis sp. 36 PRJEB53466]|nr:unnamed protein product [Caenorhabditis sp. 36 PRJEB53466]
MALVVEGQKVKSLSELKSMKLHCSSPNRELIVYPKWLCFHSESQYKSPQFVKFFIENREPHPIAYLIKAREKIFRIDGSAGILEPAERRIIKLFLISSDEWPLAINEYTQKRLKIAVESLKIPVEIQPNTVKEASQMAKAIWKRAFNEWPLERLYTKINVTLNATPVSAPPTTTVTTKFAL